MENFELVMRDRGSVLIMNQDANDLLSSLLCQVADLRRFHGEDTPEELANVAELAHEVLTAIWGS